VKDGTSISLSKVHSVLGWPTPSEVTHPEGAGAAVFASLARDKIGRALARFDDGQDALVGVLVPDSYAVTTEPPIAVVVDFRREAKDETLRELHRLSWNFSHCPTLITIEPGLLRVWSCCESPDATRDFEEFLVHEIEARDLSDNNNIVLENSAARALHWVNLVSGDFFAKYPDRFSRDGRADQMLLGNLRHIRKELIDHGLVDDDVCHDLLARIIFVQFLFDRKDSDGAAALTPLKLARLHAEGVLSSRHKSLDSILSDYKDTYCLFDWLNTRFNGDLFPGKGDTVESRALGWAKEKAVVSRQHLALLARFIRGDVDMPSGQGCLWPQYSFDVIPLEFISSIYETFVTERAAQDGIFYTPPHLVDFVLDRVLPWDGCEWDLKILDPACGSGIFLVKAFQRLVYRWKRVNPGQPIRAELLRRLLERNIFGVDKDPHAVRVACFSLYLAMCDEIEPRNYWTQVVFPTMRDRRLICSDFFAEDQIGFRSSEGPVYDLVIGNAPWGDGLVTELAQDWTKADERSWTVANKDIGGLFLPKSALLLKSDGRIAMIQSANSLLFNSSTKAVAFRRELFSTHRIEEVYNLSALRFKVFKGKTHTTKTSVSPSCVVIMRVDKPALDDYITYVSPKNLKPLVDEFTIVIEPQDRRRLTVRDAIKDLSIWTTLMWGGARDRILLGKLRRFSTLASVSEDFASKSKAGQPSGESNSAVSLEEERHNQLRPVKSREGIIFGDRKKSEPQLYSRRLFDGKVFPQDSRFYLDVDSLPIAGEIRTHSRDSTDFSAFSWPQLIIKQSWQKSLGRFQARLAVSHAEEGVICNQSYVSVHADPALLEAACLTCNSILAVYFLQLTSGRIAAYRPEALVRELMDLPLAPVEKNVLAGVEDFDALDAKVFEVFGLKDAERVLVEDMFNYTLADFRGNEKSAGRQTTGLMTEGSGESYVSAYCEYFSRVLKAGFGRDKEISATIFRGEQGKPLPYRLVAFELGKKTSKPISIVDISTVALLQELERLDKAERNAGVPRRGIYNERVVRIYDGSSGTPTVFIVKPDMARYWTRGAGINDADEVSLDLFRWAQSSLSMEASS